MKQTKPRSIEEIIRICGEPLKLHDWFFEECPEEERRSCFYYEYLRESRVVTRLWKQWQNFNPFKEIKAKGSSDRIRNRYFVARKCLQRHLNLQRRQFEKCVPVLKDPWPEVPWLDLPKEERANRLWNDEQAARIYPDVSTSQLGDLVDLISESALPERIFVLMIPEGANRKDVTDCFERAVVQFSKKNPGYFEENEKGQSGVFPKLRKLGGWRLRKYKAYCQGQNVSVTDEDLVRYQQICLKKALKTSAKTRYSPDDAIDAAVEKAIPYSDWQHLGTAEDDARRVLNSLIRTSGEAREAVRRRSAEEAGEPDSV